MKILLAKAELQNVTMCMPLNKSMKERANKNCASYKIEQKKYAKQDIFFFLEKIWISIQRF